MATTAVRDVDGTLVDTNHQHAIAWPRALRASRFAVQVWRIHRQIGIGGDQIVAALVGEDGVAVGQHRYQRFGAAGRLGRRLADGEARLVAQVVELGEGPVPGADRDPGAGQVPGHALPHRAAGAEEGDGLGRA